MLKVKRCKEIKINNEKHKIKYGILDKNSEDSIYLNISSWVKIHESDHEINYNHEFKLINKKIKIVLFSELNKKYFNNKLFIVDVTIRKNGLSHKNKSFLNCEITLFKDNKIKFNTDEIKNEVNNLVNKLLSSCLNDNELFQYSIKK